MKRDRRSALAPSSPYVPMAMGMIHQFSNRMSDAEIEYQKMLGDEEKVVSYDE